MESPFVRIKVINDLRIMYFRADGSGATFLKGSRAWRNQNPGNIGYGNSKLMKALGAIGKARGLAVFPDRETGRKAIFLLLKTETYQEYTLNQAIEAWAPPGENDTEAYKQHVHDWTHFDMNRKVKKVIKEYFQGYRCEIHEMVPGRMEEAVALGRADLGLTYLPIPHPDLDFLRIREIEMGIFGLPRIISGVNYETIPFAVPISPVEGSPNKVRGLDGWPDDAFPRNSAYQVEMLETALGLCREGIAVAFVPRFVVQLHNQLVKSSLRIEELPLPPKFPKKKVYVYLIKRKSDHEGTSAKKIAQAIRSICKQI